MKKVESIWAELSAKAQETSKEVAQEPTELSTEKVELAAADDLKDASQNAKQLINAFNKTTSQVESGAKELIKVGGRVSSSIFELSKVMQKVEASAKELGVDTKSVDGYAEAKRIVSEAGAYDEVRSIVQRIIGDLNEFRNG